MRSIARGILLRSLVPLSLLGCRDAPAQAGRGSTMFRGGPTHSGFSGARFFEGQGGIRWRVQTEGAVRSSPAVTATRVFAGSGDGHLYAIDRASGNVVWRFAAGGGVHASPAVAGGLVIAATIPGRIFAVDEGSGALRWSMQTGPALPLNTSPAGGWDFYPSSPVVVDQTVVIGGQDGGVYALDLPSGRQRWRGETKGRVRATPAVSDGMVVVGSWDGRVYAWDLATGAERWVHRTVGDTLDSKKFGFDRRAVQSSAAIVDGMVFVGSRDDGLYALDAATGARRWRASHDGSWVVGSPAVHDGRVFVGSSDAHFVQAVDAKTGREVWRTPIGANALSSPLRIGNALIVGTHRTDVPWGDLIALDAATGAVRWRLRIDDAVNSSPTAADGELYVGTDGGSIVAVHQVSPVIPRLVVFHDSTLARQAFTTGNRLALEYFRQLGYPVLDADSLGAFLTARIADGVPSGVVFALDALPPSVVPTLADTVLLRRYLNAGGKVVWLGAPIGSVVRDSLGGVVDLDFRRMEQLIGVPSASVDWEQDPVQPTEEGRRWGLDRPVRGKYTIEPSAVTHALAVDEMGRATAWVRVYRRDRPGSGFVQLWGYGATVDRLPMVRAVTEYGLLRKVVGQ